MNSVSFLFKHRFNWVFHFCFVLLVLSCQGCWLLKKKTGESNQTKSSLANSEKKLFKIENFSPDVAPEDCKEKTIKIGIKSYEYCSVSGRLYYIRMLDEGTPWGVLLFKSGEPVQFEGIENPEVKVLKNGVLYAIYNHDTQEVRTDFSDADGKELMKFTNNEVSEALKAVNMNSK